MLLAKCNHDLLCFGKVVDGAFQTTRKIYANTSDQDVQREKYWQNRVSYVISTKK